MKSSIIQQCGKSGIIMKGAVNTLQKWAEGIWITWKWDLSHEQTSI